MEIVVSYEALDLVHQLANASERAASDRLLSNECEPALDLIKPARLSGGVVQVVTRMAGEPCFDPGMLVSGIVVGDQVHVEIGRDAGLEMF
jgi:hypothetical protein